jgi:hypothetical protein
MQFDSEDSVSERNIPAAKERIQRMHKLREKLVKSLKEASEVQTKYYNQNHQLIRFRKNKIVLVFTKYLRLKSVSRKMSPRYIGLYKIDQSIGV